MELDNIKVELYSALGKPKSSQAELENEIAGNDNDFYYEFIVSLSWFKGNRKIDLAKYLLQEIVWKLKETYETCNRCNEIVVFCV